jgi:hypothetical protein
MVSSAAVAAAVACTCTRSIWGEQRGERWRLRFYTLLWFSVWFMWFQNARLVEAVAKKNHDFPAFSILVF